jgi:hypothetical protein
MRSTHDDCSIAGLPPASTPSSRVEDMLLSSDGPEALAGVRELTLCSPAVALPTPSPTTLPDHLYFSVLPSSHHSMNLVLTSALAPLFQLVLMFAPSFRRANSHCHSQ